MRENGWEWERLGQNHKETWWKGKKNVRKHNERSLGGREREDDTENVWQYEAWGTCVKDKKESACTDSNAEYFF